MPPPRPPALVRTTHTGQVQASRRPQAAATAAAAALMAAGQPVFMDQAGSLSGLPSSTSQGGQPPMFVLDKVEYSLTTAPLAVAVAANTLLLALDAHRAIRVDLAQSQSVEEIELPRRTSTSDRVRYLYLDPTGRHAIFSLTNGDNYYLHARWRKAKLLSKLRGHCISSVAWAPGRSHPHSSTRPILLGTTQGRVIEAELEPADEYFRREERYIRPVHVHPEGEPITGLHILPLPGSRTQRAVILLTTKKQLYQFIGPTGQASHGSETYTPSFDTPLYGPVFQNQSNRGSAPLSPGGGRGPNVLEVPTGGKISSLALHTPAQTMMPDRMAWLVDSGSYHGRINLDPNSSSLESKNQGDSILEEGILLPFPSSLPSSTSPPMDILLTAFHFVLLLPRRILAISRLTDRVVFDVAPPGPTETFRSLTQDTAKGTFWAITDKALYELIVTGEDRDVWDTFLSKRDYTSALRYARTEGQRERVRDAQATHFLEQGLLHEAADLWARTHRSLEEVALLLMDHALTNEDGTDPTGQASSFSGEERGQAPLRHFLTQRLDSGMIEGGTGGRKMQATMVATWLVELHLSRLDRLDDLYGRTGGKARIEDASGEEEQSLAHQEFCLWIDQHKTLLDAPTTYSLMESHARWPEYLHYAGAIGDWDRVIRYYLEDRDASKALMTLSRHGTEESVYRFSGHLMEMSPRGTVDMWIQRGKELVPRRLLPILMEYELHRGPGGMPRGETTHLDQGNEEDQALRYLEFSTGRLGCRDPVVHNYLLHLLARDAGPQEEHLLAYLRRQEEQGGGAMQSREDSPGVTSVPFHVDYALRECQRHGRAQACVRLYGLKGMWEDAVDLALKEKDLELARIYADRPASLSSSSNLLDGGTEEQELRRSLWLKIARYVVEEEKDVARAMQYLQHCPLLKIEDILPLFPDFVLINDFKDEVCSALEEYNGKITELKGDMDEAMRSAENIRRDMEDLQHRFVIVGGDEGCSMCGEPLLSRPFYVFPCQHVFHADCLVRQVQTYLSSRQTKRLQEIQALLAKDVIGRGPTSRFQDSESLKEELDDLVAGDCVLCGERMIRGVEKPFITNGESKEIASWAL